MKLLNHQQIGQGPNIILIHGLFGSLENLAMVAKGLQTNYRVTSVDVRNHGSSFHENNMDYHELAQDIINLMNSLQITKAHLLGHSMGGKIAMQCAINHPERVNKLIVADIAPIQYPPHHQKIINGLKSIDTTKLTSRKDADLQLAQYVDELAIRQFLLRNLASNSNSFFFKCQLNNIADCYSQIMAKNTNDRPFQGETLFVKGGNSNYITQEHSEIIKNIFPNSRAKIIQGAGHWLHAEKSIAFNKNINDFLAL